MNLNERFPVTPGKLQAVLDKIRRLGINPALIEEGFSRGGGKGGQKVNKTSSRVQLSYPPLELAVACQRERSRSLNRFLALRELVDQIEMKISPETSDKLAEIQRLRKRKAEKSRRAAQKHGEMRYPSEP